MDVPLSQKPDRNKKIVNNTVFDEENIIFLQFLISKKLHLYENMAV